MLYTINVGTPIINLPFGTVNITPQNKIKMVMTWGLFMIGFTTLTNINSL
jgi:hypothetical protein